MFMPERPGACVAACRALLEGEPELLADFAAIFTDAGIRWERLPDDLRLGFADIAWEHLQGQGLAPGPGDRRFIRRSERRCPSCGGAEPVYRSHLDWGITTFWVALVIGIIGFVLLFILIGWLVLGLLWLWTAYRIVRGWLRLLDNRGI